MTESIDGQPASGRQRGGARKGEPRRDNLTGSISTRARRGKVQWVARWPVPRSVRACGWVERVAPTERAARAKLKELREEHERGRFTPGGDWELADYLRWWVAEVAQPRLEPSTHRRYVGLIERQLIPNLPNLTLAELEPHHVQRLLGELRARGRVVRKDRRAPKEPPPASLAARTVQQAFAVLRAALNTAVAFGYVPTNVATRVDTPAAPRAEIEPLTIEQARKLLTAVRGHRLEAFYRVAMALGLRVGEATRLRWQDVDLANQRLTIRRETSKSKKTRSLLLPPTLVAALEAHRRRQDQERLLQDDRWREHGLIFPSQVGTPLRSRNLLRHFQAKCAKLGFPRFHVHQLRHTAASLMLAQGLPLKVVQEILGHSQIALTADTYSHLLVEVQQDAAERLDGLLRRLDEPGPPTGDGRQDGPFETATDERVDGRGDIDRGE